MELWTPPWSEQEYTQRWEAAADAATFRPPGAPVFTRAYTGGRRYAQLESLLLSPQEHRVLTEASGALGSILTRVVEWVQRSPVLLPVLGVPPPLEPWVTREPGSGAFALLTRLDWLPDTDGRWWCVECNADTPGGVPEATVWQGLAFRTAVDSVRLTDPNADLTARLGAALQRALPGVVGFFTSPGHLEDWENTLAAALARGGETVTGGLPAALEDGEPVLVAGRPVDSLYRFYPGDWLGRHPDLLKRLAEGLPCANPGRALIAQSKALFALLWHLVDEHQFLTPAERDWIVSFVPRTGLAPLSGPWVGKPYWEREGAGILHGVGEGPAAPSYAYQQQVDVATLPLRVWTGQGARFVAARPVVGVYLVEGEPAGYLTRMGGPVTDKGAHMVPTFIREES